jgi:5-formyltetrahydrofolate cyclo-ligase
MEQPFFQFLSIDRTRFIMKKAEARILFRQQRSSLTTLQVNVFQDLLLIQFQELALPYFNYVHAYLPIYKNNEPDTDPLLEWLKFSTPGLQIVYPKVSPLDFSMKHYLHEDDMYFDMNQYGIPEPVGGKEIMPEELDLVFVPLLGFDLQGNRVGYGKGYYDRFLSKCKEDVIKVGLSFLSPIDCIEDVDFFDKKLDFCITPERVYAF